MLKKICGKMASCAVANVVFLTIAGMIYRAVRRIVRSGKSGTFIAGITGGGRKTVTPTTATFTEIEPDAYQTNGEKIDDTLI